MNLWVRKKTSEVTQVSADCLNVQDRNGRRSKGQFDMNPDFDLMGDGVSIIAVIYLCFISHRLSSHEVMSSSRLSVKRAAERLLAPVFAVPWKR